MSGLYDEYCDILKETKDRIAGFDDELKTKLSSLPKEKMMDLFQSRVYYPELTELNFITFIELSNECMKKILDQKFILTFTCNDSRYKLYGKSIEDVEINSIYRKTNNEFDDFLAILNDKPVIKKEEVLPNEDSLINLFPKMDMLKIKLPVGFFV